MNERQQQIVKNVDRHRQMVLDAERWLWAHPQTGFTEWEAHGYMKEKFEAMGYELTLAGNIPALPPTRILFRWHRRSLPRSFLIILKSTEEYSKCTKPAVISRRALCFVSFGTF